MCDMLFLDAKTETDVEMALDPSHVLYDMDNDAEQFLAKIHECSDAENSASYEITKDMFDKASYVKQLHHFTLIEIQELMAGVRSLKAMKTIYELCVTKRQSKGMPLIRHHLQAQYRSLCTWVDHQIFTTSQHPERRRAMMMMEMPENISGPTKVDVGGNDREESPTIGTAAPSSSKIVKKA